MSMPPKRAFTMVVVKLIAPIREEAPTRCRERIVKSTAGPA